ncbi:MAG: FtsW/RodA/SpoVE family cell cycle protein [Candidatus Contendobacter sp.]|nr:FtsW/RodA/SpoVE family cell cycle protein [Candidatus Contendobacter sp.]
MAATPTTPINPRPTPVRPPAPTATALLARPETLEFLLTLLVLAVLTPLFLQLRGLASDGDGRFAPNYLWQVRLPPKILPDMCRQFGGRAPPKTAADFCGDRALGAETPGERLPVSLETALADLRNAFAEPLAEPLGELKRARQLLQEGLAEKGEMLPDRLEAIQSAETALKPYLSNYKIAEDAAEQGPLPLQCLHGLIAQAWRDTRDPDARAALALWLAAALDGDERVKKDLDDGVHLALDRAWHGPASAKGQDRAGLDPSTRRACADYASPQQAAEAAAGVVQKARDEANHAHKAAAMRHLLQNAWWHWLLWTLWAGLLVAVARRNPDPLAATGAALAGWAALAWATAVRGWSGASPEPWLPPWACWIVGGAGVALWLWRSLRSSAQPQERPPQRGASPFAYPGLLLFAGLGWLLLLDLSATGHPRNRYLGLYQHDHLFLALLVVSLASVWRCALGAFFTRSLPLLRSGFDRYRVAASLLVFALVIVAFAIVGNSPQITSELGRLWLILGSAWFFYMRGDLAFDPNNAKDAGWRWFGRFLSPLLFVLAALLLAMIVTQDMGPLLISVYGGGVFLASAAAFALHRRGSPLLAVWAGTAVVVLLWLALVTGTVFVAGSWHSTTAGRLESMAAPLMANNDQMALIGWFRQHTPLLGYGVGEVPWCGQAVSGACHGVPLQIQSDYIFTGLWGLFGPAMTWALAGAMLVWLYLLARPHPGATNGKPAMIALPSGNKAWDDQAFLSWLCVVWLALTACQLGVTVAGNLRILPLTGVTYPFMSYGKWSLYVNALFLGLCLNLNLNPKTPWRA